MVIDIFRAAGRSGRRSSLAWSFLVQWIWIRRCARAETVDCRCAGGAGLGDAKRFYEFARKVATSAKEIAGSKRGCSRDFVELL